MIHYDNVPMQYTAAEKNDNFQMKKNVIFFSFSRWLEAWNFVFRK